MLIFPLKIRPQLQTPPPEGSGDHWLTGVCPTGFPCFSNGAGAVMLQHRWWVQRSWEINRCVRQSCSAMKSLFKLCAGFSPHRSYETPYQIKVRHTEHTCLCSSIIACGVLWAVRVCVVRLVCFGDDRIAVTCFCSEDNVTNSWLCLKSITSFTSFLLMGF